jgi:hypothetical protein
MHTIAARDTRTYTCMHLSADASPPCLHRRAQNHSRVLPPETYDEAPRVSATRLCSPTGGGAVRARLRWGVVYMHQAPSAVVQAARRTCDVQTK